MRVRSGTTSIPRLRRHVLGMAGVLATAALLLTAVAAAAPTAGAASSGAATRQSLPVNPRTHLRPGITPMVPGGIRPYSAPAGAHLSYYGGPVISNMKSVDVIYGSGSFAPYIGSFITQFTNQFLGSGVMDWLHQYNTPSSGGTGQTIGRSTAAGTYTIAPAVANTGSVIQDSNVTAELVAQIGAGHLPVPDANTSYAVFFPHGEQICQGGSCSGVAGGFCAYHGTFTYGSVTTTYQVMPDNQVGSGLETGCGSGTLQQNETSVLSHELVETITDPNVGLATVLGPPLGWYDAANGEIGDICNGQQGSFVGSDGVTYTSQLQFSNAAADCILSPISAPVITSAPSTLVTLGTALHFTVTTTGFPVPTITETGSLPTGVSLMGGLLAGVPTQSGSYPITLTAHNSAGPDATQAFTLTVGGTTPATVTITNLPSVAYLGDSFVPSVGTDGDGATSVTSSTPSVCRLTSGAVVGIAIGTCTLVAHEAAGVNFAAGDGAPQSYQVLGFTITTSSLPGATRGSNYGPVTLTVAGAGQSTSPDVTTFKWAKVALPKGLKLSRAGVLTGIPNAKLATGSNPVTVNVTETVTTLNGTKKVKTRTTVQAVIPLVVS